ncbi:unnamed protein product (macronuclear) [Paramecium tetraurelia]|uniref:Chromosome undetermined scaffold_81, whole genome shotgun sequence n=3 Tax=Paramecium TaxID=5884 RepID=Q3SDK5_PARTE|nr:uncharacterized protein GSPATT00024009001 [Paramecium tetraurelia]CAD8178364.1 unnamed protein product [Paramecium pentaurelia]CAD8184011.1 unnamed protein product [Paramecium octaurelia]CAI39353.1 rab_B78 [Paramecium tetraurelia]CAK91281.1 unnamed protein product [Paramecium tetraurelia]|eukprot:XP_001458678.1 hypothetical protein (macronuclear) [Paramecium tetraurelia strain d4-2]
MFKGSSIKILLIGPQQSGKSRLANYIADREDISQNGYRPTAGVRILEFEKEAPKNPKRPGSEKVIVELWDMSGDNKYDSCWPAVMKDAQGVICVYNAENPKHEQELEWWVNQISKKAGIPAAQNVVFAHHLTGKAIKGQSKLPKSLSSLTVHDTSIEEGNQTIHPAFEKFFNSLMLSIYEKQEKEENRLMN